MSGKVINFEERKRKALIKKADNVADLSAKFQHRSIHDDIPRVEKNSIAFEAFELRTLLQERDKAMASGLIRDYAAPMSTSARPIFSFKERAQDPDLISMEKARVDSDTIYIVRKQGQTPNIKTTFESALDIIRDEFDTIRKKSRIHLIPHTPEPESP